MSIVSMICKFYFEHSTTFFPEMFFFTIFHCPVELALNFKEKFKRQLQYMQYLLCDFDFSFHIQILQLYVLYKERLICDL